MKIIIALTLFTALLLAPLTALHAAESPAEKSSLARPTPEQLDFMDLELGAFIHFDLNTFTGQEHGDGFELPSRFNPTALDVEQWVRTAKSMGAKYVVLTARHEGGFCLWPTKTTDYGIKSSPYQNGKGDIVRDFVNACRKHGVIPGLYHTATFDAHHTFKPEDQGKVVWGKSGLMQQRFQEMGTDGRAKFRERQVAQITELLTDYGPIAYIWCDHWNGTDPIWRAVFDAMRRLQPQCLMMGPDVWLTGNEAGYVTYPMWNAVNTVDGTIHSRPAPTKGDTSLSNDYGLLETDVNTGHPLGKIWRSRESVTNTGFARGGWFWHPGKTSAKSFAEHIDLYYRTIGLGASLMINLPPDQRGLIPDDLVAAAKNLGDEIQRRFAHPVTELKTIPAGDTVELKWEKPSRIDTVVLMENIAHGQKIASYTLEAQVDGQWTELKPANKFIPYKGPYNVEPGFETIGRKKIDRIEPVMTSHIRFRCLKSVAQPVELRWLAVFDCASDDGK